MKVVLALLLAALLVAGCGRGDDERATQAVTQRFLTAVTAKDGALACAQLSPDARKALESQERKPCAQAAPDVEVKPGRILRAHVYITSAKVDVASGQSAFLNRTPAGWKLTAVGCEPAGGKAADRPFDCELEA